MYKSITLEVSLKPFKETTDEYIKKVCRGIFEQWKPLTKNAETVKVLMWSSDGSEILDYRGNIDDAFEWAYMIGGANPKGNHPKDLDPNGEALHSTYYLYTENPPVMTYKILKKIVTELKNAGNEILSGKKIMVGTTFDVGPEFAKSSFKYERHNEICKGNVMGKATIVCAYAKLNGDNVSYAGFPDGIPDGLDFGTFFGRQSNIFMKDMGFDYIWFSNGLGFGMEPWSANGATFDGEKFDVSGLPDVKKAVTGFWELFRKECPDFPIETRGTNMSMGIDYASDGVPLKDIYDGGFNLLPPPNSPWAAINSDFGLELMGHMSRIAYLNSSEYLYRYYLHDPWWANSPWYDRYNSMAHDIYMPMAIARIDENGKLIPPSHLNLLSIDNCWGGMPDCCVNEVIPHLLKADKETPTDAAPLVWVYPFDEYMGAETNQELKEMYSEDWFIRGAINEGLPLNCVTTTSAFVKQDKNLYKSSVIVTTVPKANTEFEKTIFDYVENGGKVIFYGNSIDSSDKFKELVGITETGADESGEFPMYVKGEFVGNVIHADIVSGGGLSAKADDEYIFAKCGEYAAATKKGNCMWVRATVSADYVPGAHLLEPHDREKYFLAETLMRLALNEFGWKIEFEKDDAVKPPVMTIHRHNNAYVFASFSSSTTVKTSIKAPLGAPILDAYDTKLENGYATYHLPKAERKECRVFVEQEDGIVSCCEEIAGSVKYRRRVLVKGLKNATVRFLAEDYCKDNVFAQLNTCRPYYPIGDKFEAEYKTDGHLTYYEVKNVTGNMLFSMPAKD